MIRFEHELYILQHWPVIPILVELFQKWADLLAIVMKLFKWIIHDRVVKLVNGLEQHDIEEIQIAEPFW